MAKIISITSGKGGVGKSTVAVGLAAAYARRGKKALIIEMDLGLRGLDLMLGMENQIVYDLGDVLADRCKPQDAVAISEQLPALSYLAAPSRPVAQLDFEKLLHCIGLLKRQYDIIVLDMPAGLGLSMAVSQRAADLALIVATPDPVCIRDGAKVASMMEEEGFRQYRVFINRVSRTAIKKSSIHDLDDVIDGVGAPLIGVLTEDIDLQNAQSKGMFLPESERSSMVFAAVSGRLDGEYAPLIITRL